MLRFLIVFSSLTLSSGAFAALADNCQVQYREITPSGLIKWSVIKSTPNGEGRDFVSPKDGGNYRFRLFSNAGGTPGFIRIDAIIQDMSVTAYSTQYPNVKLTTANGYIAHSIVEVKELQPLPLLLVASEKSELVVECRNIAVAPAR